MKINTYLRSEFVLQKQEAHISKGVEQSFKAEDRLYLFNTLKPSTILFPTKRKEKIRLMWRT
jgi:hypothetical protein